MSFVRSFALVVVCGAIVDCLRRRRRGLRPRASVSLRSRLPTSNTIRPIKRSSLVKS